MTQLECNCPLGVNQKLFSTCKRAALIHIVGDLVQSVGVLIAGIVIKFVNHEQAHLGLIAFQKEF